MRIRDAHKENLIRQHALEMVVEKGFDGLSMQKLARAAGVSPATIYIYFKDRDDLLLQVYAEVNEKMAEATLKDFDPAMPFDEGLKVQWLNRARYFLKNPMHMHFTEQVRFSPLMDRAEELIDKKFLMAMKEFVSNAIAKGELTPLPVEVYWSVAFAPLYQLVKFHMHGRSLPGQGKKKFVLNNELLMQTLSVVLKGLKP